MIAFWGEPGAHEPWADTPVSFLGVDGRWRVLTRRQLDGSTVGWLGDGDTGSLSPDGTRWITNSRDKLTMLDLRTGLTERLPAGQSAYTSWSPNSRFAAVWNPNRGGAPRLRDRVAIVDRSGDLVGELPADVRNREVFVTDDGSVTIWRTSTTRTPALRATMFDIDGRLLRHLTCALPAGFPPHGVGVAGYDGRFLWISGLVDARHVIYRNTTIDTMNGTVTQDIQVTGHVPYLTDWVEPGVFVSSIAAGPSALYAVDPDSGMVAPMSGIEPYPDQEGYENHASSQFATDRIFQ